MHLPKTLILLDQMINLFNTMILMSHSVLPKSKIIILPLCEDIITRSLLYKADEFLEVW